MSNHHARYSHDETNDSPPVHLEAYNPEWPAMFERERAMLAGVLEPWLAGPVEHVGSTAVPGMIAKPIIDIMAGVESLDASREAIQALIPCSYIYFPYRAEVMHWFCKPTPGRRTHHLHLVPFESSLWLDRIAFRDCLRSDPATAGEYAALKRRLATEHEFDREAYTEAKGPFILRMTARARTGPHNERTG